MNRIPTEGLKPSPIRTLRPLVSSLNEQNPDRGIETVNSAPNKVASSSLNEQNPDRGIETAWILNGFRQQGTLE